MADDIFHAKSPNELSKEIQQLVRDDNRSLPERAKIFSAIATIQKFNQLPDITTPEDLTKKIAEGDRELNRGMTGTKGVPAAIYARDLLLGPMYPGTLAALGNGIYLATTQAPTDPLPAIFPTISKIAIKYAQSDEGGVIVRCALKSTAKVLEYDGLKEFCRDNRNRARQAGLTDMGSIAAALGFEAYYRDHIEAGIDERVWVVVNRNALTFQKEGLQYAPKSVP